MRKITLLLFVLISISLQAQKVKIKKGEIFLDKAKVGSVEKIKVKGFGNNYLKFFNNEKEHLFSAKPTLQESKYFGKLETSRYYIIECIKQNDTIIVNDTRFYINDKKATEYFIESGILESNGFSSAKTDKILSQVNLKPAYVLDKEKKDSILMKKSTYLVNREKSDPIFVERFITKTTSTDGTEEKLVGDGRTKYIKYRLLQGKKDSKREERTLIGYAYQEPSSMKIGDLTILNRKNVPIAYFTSFSHYTFNPFVEVKCSPSERLDLGKLTLMEAIFKYTQMLIDENKL